MAPPHIPPEAFTAHSARWGFCLALMFSFAASLGVLAAFVWRDFINNLFRYYGIDFTNEFATQKEVLIGLSIALTITLFAAALFLATARVGAKWAAAVPRCAAAAP